MWTVDTLAATAVIVSGSIAHLCATAVRVDAGIQLIGKVAVVRTFVVCRAGCVVSVVVIGGVRVASTDGAGRRGTVVPVTVNTGVGSVGGTAVVGAVGALRVS